MDYFWIRQDRRYIHVPTISNLHDFILTRLDLYCDKADKIPDYNIGYDQSDIALDYPDVVDIQLFLISEKMKDVFSFYENDIKYKKLCILNIKLDVYFNYCIPIFNEVDCVSSKSIMNADKSHITNLILNKTVIGDKCIFKVANVAKEIIIIRLDVAESLLRRSLSGMIITPIEIQ